MRSVAVAEWVLARYAGEQRAWTIMGDLLEEGEQKGSWWFWRAYAGVLFAVARRPVLAFVAAFFAAGWAWNLLMNQQIGIWQGPVLGAELAVTTFLGVSGWFAAMYSGVRYGVSDALTHLAGAVAVLATIAMFLCRHEWALWGWGGSAVALIIGCTIVPASRKAAIVFLVTGAAFFVAFLAMVFASSAYTQYVLHVRLLGSKELQDHPSIGYLEFVVQVLGQAITAWLCKETHRILLERRPRVRVID